MRRSWNWRNLDETKGGPCMKRFFCLLMSLMCLCLPAAHATGVDAED